MYETDRDALEIAQRHCAKQDGVKLHPQPAAQLGVVA